MPIVACSGLISADHSGSPLPLPAGSVKNIVIDIDRNKPVTKSAKFFYPIIVFQGN